MWRRRSGLRQAAAAVGDERSREQLIPSSPAVIMLSCATHEVEAPRRERLRDRNRRRPARGTEPGASPPPPHPPQLAARQDPPPPAPLPPPPPAVSGSDNRAAGRLHAAPCSRQPVCGHHRCRCAGVSTAAAGHTAAVRRRATTGRRSAN